MSDEVWVACSEPERPPDSYVRWCETECTACAIKLGVVLNSLDPTDPLSIKSIQVCHFLLNRVAPEGTRNV